MNSLQNVAAYRNGTSPEEWREVALHRHTRALEHELRRYHQENTALRKQLRESHKASRIARRAREDALALVADLHAGLLVSLEAMQERRGMSRRRWEWARAMLAMTDCTNRYYRLVIQDPAEIDRRLSEAAEEITLTLDLGDLERHLPPSRRRERWQW